MMHKSKKTGLKTILRNEIIIVLLRGTSFRSEKELAKILGVTTKTIERGIKEIEANIDLYRVEVIEKRTTRKNLKENTEGNRLYRILDYSAKESTTLSNEELVTLYQVVKASIKNTSTINRILNIITKNQIPDWHLNQIRNNKGLCSYETIVSTVKNAIKKGQYVLLKQYYSRDRGMITKDEKIIPVMLDEPGRKVYALVDNQRKYFKFENIDSIEALSLKHNQKQITWNPLENRDIFGFLPNKDLSKIHVTLHLDRFARSQLLTQFPHIFEFLKEIKTKSIFCYELAIQVYDIEPIARFVTGLFDRIKVMGDQDAKDKIEQYYLNKVSKGYKENYQ